MIKNITLKFGATPASGPLSITPSPVTVFVGPNNAGKSKVLAELHQYCSIGHSSAADQLIESIEFDGFPKEKIAERIKQIALKPRPSEAVPPDHIVVGNPSNRRQVSRDLLKQCLEDPNTHSRLFCKNYLRYRTLILDGQSRIRLVDEQDGGDLQKHPERSFQVLFTDDVLRSEVRRIIHDAFGSHLVIDPTKLGRLRLRLSDIEPSSHSIERGIDEEAVQFHRRATPISEASDGVKAFTGIITEIFTGDPEVLFIDEPEAFLHPSLSFNLGKEVSAASSGSGKRLFVSTHSPNFVMGCIQSGVPVNIVRLTYRGGVATARLLSSKKLLALMRNPLLRSTGVLGGLFYEFVVVTEADADRAFYQEINERLLKFKPEWGIPNCLFLNAQNKQTVETVLRPLRDLGIPAAGIVDIDVLKDGGSNWTKFLSAASVPEIERNPMGTLRSTVKAKINSTGKDMKRDGGIDLLSGSDKEAANNLCEKLQEYGLFIVKGGELESWLSNLDASGHGPNWLVAVFSAMGENPTSAEFVKPADDDVWAFLGSIKSWLTNPSRKGIPLA